MLSSDEDIAPFLEDDELEFLLMESNAEASSASGSLRERLKFISRIGRAPNIERGFVEGHNRIYND